MPEICATFDGDTVATIDELMQERPNDYPTRAAAVTRLVAKSLSESKELTQVTISMLEYKTKVVDLQRELESKDKQLSDALHVQSILASNITEPLKRSSEQDEETKGQ